MKKSLRPPICSSCREDLFQGWTAPCGHSFCRHCLDANPRFRCPIDLEHCEVTEMIEDRWLCDVVAKGYLKAAENAEGLGSRQAVHCEEKESCPDDHMEEDLFKSMIPVFPEAAVKSELAEEVLSEYLDIEGVEEPQSSGQAYLQQLARHVSAKMGLAYHWLKSL